MNYTILSKKTYQLSTKEINKICVLKNTHWKHGLKSQIAWFTINTKKNDIHNIFYFKSQVIGYTLLRNRTCKINTILKKYLLFDTLILKKNFRKKNMSSLLMNFNNQLIRLSNKFSFLICDNKMINFYKKFNWKILEKKKFVMLTNTSNKKGMIFNQKNLIKKNNLKYKFLTFK